MRVEIRSSTSPGKPHPVRGHGIFGLHHPDGNRQPIGPAIAHNADATHRQQDRKGLPNFLIQPGATYLFHNDGVGLPQRCEMLPGDLA